jgi:hypothetical protein
MGPVRRGDGQAALGFLLGLLGGQLLGELLLLPSELRLLARQLLLLILELRLGVRLLLRSLSLGVRVLLGGLLPSHRTAGNRAGCCPRHGADGGRA